MIKKQKYSQKTNIILKTTLFLILIFLSCQSILAQFYWQRTYISNIGGDEYAQSICETDSNNFYIGGVAAPLIRKLFIVKINQFGDTLWKRTYSDGEIYALATSSDGGCIYAGVRGSVAIAGRINSNGDTLWQRTFNAINLLDIKKTPDNNYILCGVEYSNDKYNGYIVKINNNGSIIWEKIYSSIVSIDFLTIEIDQNGGFIGGGIKVDFNGGPRLSYICKLNDTGGVLWDRAYNLSNDNYCSSIQQNGTGYIFTGRSLNNAYIQKINMFGDSLQNNVIISSNNINTSPKLLKFETNKYYLIHVNGSASRIYVLDSNLNVFRQLTLQVPNPNALKLLSLVRVSNSLLGDMIMVGYTDYQEFANLDFYAVRIDSSLTPPPPLGIIGNSENVPNLYNILHQCFPNPFNPSTMFKVELKKSGNVLLQIYDYNGRLVEVIENKFYNAGIFYFRFSAKGISSGIYFYQLFVDEKLIDTKKMCLLK